MNRPDMSAGIASDELIDLDLEDACEAEVAATVKTITISETVSDFDLATATNRVRKLFDGMKANAVEIGREFTAVKAKLPHGEFGKWLSAEFGMSDRSAQNYMNAAIAVERNKELIILPDKALYLLGAKSTPPEIVKQVVEGIKAGTIPATKAIETDVRTAREEAVKLAALTKGLSAEEAAKKVKKINEDRKKRAAAQKAKDEARRAEWESKREEADKAANAAVAFLMEHLGNRYVEFANLYELTDSFSFSRAMHHVGKRSNVVTLNPQKG